MRKISDIGHQTLEELSACMKELVAGKIDRKQARKMARKADLISREMDMMAKGQISTFGNELFNSKHDKLLE